VILRLHHALAAGDADPGKIVTQPRQRALLQEAGQVLRTVGQQLAAADTDEKIEILVLHRFGVGPARRIGHREMGEPARARNSDRRLSRPASGARASSTASSAYSCARARSTSSTAPVSLFSP
jgi:hypothetical protein